MNKTSNSVLIVDDEPINLRALMEILSKEYTVYAEINGANCIKSAQDIQPDLILLDVVMPSMGGFDVIKCLKQNVKTKHIPIIFVTGKNSPEDEAYGFTLGAVDYINKPYNELVVTMRVRHQIEIINRTRENQRITAIEEASLAKSRFLARVSHEIRTPITAVLGISELQLRNNQLEPQTEEAFVRIYDSSKNLLNIVNDILDFSKIESGKMPIISKKYDVPALINNAAQLHLIYLEQKNVEFKIYVDENLPTELSGDPLRIRQIINNLLTNAFKYTDTGEVSISFKCENISENIINLIIEIKDTGRGMSPKQLEAAQGEYIRIKESETKYVSGTGLGIPIVISLSELMNSKINFESEAGKGTAVTICIPQEISDSTLIGPDLAKTLENHKYSASISSKTFDFVPEQFPNGTVLVVDDIDTNLYVAEAMLQTFGITVEICSNGQEAIDLIKSGRVYDIIFMDHMMPEMDGIEATIALRNLGYIHPIVALTANAVKGQAELFLDNGFSGFMSKPIDIKILNSYLVRFI